MKNSDVAKAFANGYNAKTKNMFTEEFGNVVYSYGRHFPIAIRIKDGYILNKDKYSPSTSCHQTLVKGAIEENNIVAKLDTDQIKGIIEYAQKPFTKRSFKDITLAELVGDKL